MSTRCAVTSASASAHECQPEASPESLAAENQRLREALAEATARIRDLEAIRQNLEHQMALFKRCLFGSRSEKVSAEELEARIAEHAREARQEAAQAKRPDDPPPEAEEEQPEEPAAGAEGSHQESTPASKTSKRKARPHGRAPLPAHLPRRRIDHADRSG